MHVDSRNRPIAKPPHCPPCHTPNSPRMGSFCTFCCPARPTSPAKPGAAALPPSGNHICRQDIGANTHPAHPPSNENTLASPRRTRHAARPVSAQRPLSRYGHLEPPFVASKPAFPGKTCRPDGIRNRWTYRGPGASPLGRNQRPSCPNRLRHGPGKIDGAHPPRNPPPHAARRLARYRFVIGLPSGCPFTHLTASHAPSRSP